MTEHGFAPRDHFRIVTKYKLGVVLDPVRDDDRAFTGMLCIPYLTTFGGVQAVKYRRLDGGQPKNLVPLDQKHRLYNTTVYEGAGDFIGLAEGEPDTIAATEMLGIPTLGIPGVESWKANRAVWAPSFKNFQKVYVFVQGDPVNQNTGLRPGEELGKAIRESLKWRVRLVKCPEGDDVASMCAAGRADELTKQFGDGDEDD